MTTDAALTLAAAARPAFVDGVHRLLDELWAADATLTTALRHRFETAVVEIVGNVVIHSPVAAGHDEVMMRLQVRSSASRLVADIEDDGGPPEHPDELGAADSGLPGEDAEHGRGLPLARAVSDELTYRREADRNLWRVMCLR